MPNEDFADHPGPPQRSASEKVSEYAYRSGEARITDQMQSGILNCVGELTIDSAATTHKQSDDRVKDNSIIWLMPIDAAGRTIINASYIDPITESTLWGGLAEGSFTIKGFLAPGVNVTLRYAIIG